MAVLAVAAALLGVAGEGSPSPKVAPELPRRLVDTTLVAPSGRTIAVAAGGNFQGALNAAQPGDVITLQAGATFTGPFALPAKPGAGWIIVRTSAPDTALPPPDTRIDPSHASVMPKIVVRGPMWTFAIRAAPGALSPGSAAPWPDRTGCS